MKRILFAVILIVFSAASFAKEVVAEGKVRAYDMLKLKGTPDVINQGAASTKQMADAIIAKL